VYSMRRAGYFHVRDTPTGEESSGTKGMAQLGLKIDKTCRKRSNRTDYFKLDGVKAEIKKLAFGAVVVIRERCGKKIAPGH
jgi:hypothetical protein